jgi:hypothetical protein
VTTGTVFCDSELPKIKYIINGYDKNDLLCDQIANGRIKSVRIITGDIGAFLKSVKIVNLNRLERIVYGINE